MKFLFCITTFLFISCIPIAIKPTIEDYKITNGKNFKSGLPNKTSFIFEDPKNANEFYTYINVKFNRNTIDAEYNIPIAIGSQTFYMTFFEAERTTKTVNVLPMAADVLLSANNLGSGTTFNNVYTSRKGSWYISIIVLDNEMKDILAQNNKTQQQVVDYLSALKKEYLSTANYQEVYFKNPPSQ
jgi:hypothetical protein